MSNDGRNFKVEKSADSCGVHGVHFVPDQIREMVAWVSEYWVEPNRRGGFVTEQIANTSDYLAHPSVDLESASGFRGFSLKPRVELDGGKVYADF